MFEEIVKLRPYFFSLREIENTVSLDMKIPVNWEYESIITRYKGIKMKVQDNNEKFTLFSLISTATSSGYDSVFMCGNEIIRINKEAQEREQLFQQKVQELRILFQHESLNKLKELIFIENEKDYSTNRESAGQEDSSELSLAPEGDGKGPDGSDSGKEEDD